MSSLTVINQLVDKYNEKLKAIPKDTIDKLHKTLDLNEIDKVGLYELNARSFASGKIDLELSQFIYNSLRHYSDTTTAERMILMKLFEDLTKESLKDRFN